MRKGEKASLLSNLFHTAEIRVDILGDMQGEFLL